MKKDNHITEREVFEIISQKQRQTNLDLDKGHLKECQLCQDEVSSLCKTADAVRTLKSSRELRLNLLVQGVTSELYTQKQQRRKKRIPAAVAAVVLLMFGVVFYSSYFGLLSITNSNSMKLPTVVSFSSNDEQPQAAVTAQSITVLGRHSHHQATSQAIGSSVLHKGEEFSYGQSQKDSLSVASNYITTSYSTSF